MQLYTTCKHCINTSGSAIVIYCSTKCKRLMFLLRLSGAVYYILQNLLSDKSIQVCLVSFSECRLLLRQHTALCFESQLQPLMQIYLLVVPLLFSAFPSPGSPSPVLEHCFPQLNFLHFLLLELLTHGSFSG